jgi:hypothetical protein
LGPLADTKPQIARPTAKALDMRISGCGAGDVSVDRLEVQAGQLRLVRNEKGDTKDVGIPGRITIAVLPANASEPLDSCTWTLRKSTRAGATRTFKFPSCASCGGCLQNMKFKCGATYWLRVKAAGRARALRASEWSQDLGWKADCQGDAGTRCYS